MAMQMTRAEIADVTKAVESMKAVYKQNKREWNQKTESDVRKKMERSIVKRRKGGL